MMFAVLNGNGGMAQFSHGEFGGSGQWMRGGMTMIGDMVIHGQEGLSAPETVPCLTTRTNDRGMGRVPVRSDASAVLVFPAREGSLGDTEASRRSRASRDDAHGIREGP
jgi:hypothetical protein